METLTTTNFFQVLVNFIVCLESKMPLPAKRHSHFCRPILSNDIPAARVES